MERKVHGNHNMLNQMRSANSGDFFVLELVIDSLKDNPQDISDLMKEIGRVWEVCVENGQRPRYEKLRPEQKQRLKNVALVPGHNFMPPPYPSQKQVWGVIHHNFLVFQNNLAKEQTQLYVLIFIRLKKCWSISYIYPL